MCSEHAQQMCKYQSKKEKKKRKDKSRPIAKSNFKWFQMTRKNFQQSKVYFCHFTFHCICVTQCDRSKKCVGWYVLLFYDENQW